MYLLGYDIGSSSVKASLVNVDNGKCVGSAFFPKTEAQSWPYNPAGPNKTPPCGGPT
jgi:xylulokinase